MLARRHHVLLLIALSLVTFSWNDAFATVCRLPGLAGFEAPASRAKALLPRDTSDPKKAVVYIENTPKGLYFHSNFVTPGQKYASKIGGEQINEGAFAFVNIVHDQRPSDAVWKQTEQTFREDVEILLDKSVFDDSGRPLLDLGGAKKVKIVDGAAGRVISDTGVETLNRNKPPPLILNKILGCCFYGIPPHLAPGFAKALKARSFRTNDVRFLSLVRDSATDAAINNSDHVKSRQIANGSRMSSFADIEASFREAKGKTVVLVGHVEGENFVARNAKNEVSLNVPITQLRSAAKKHGVELIDLGCRTAQQIRAESLGVGVTTRFNTVDAVQSVNRALAESTNYAEFFENLTAKGLKVVVDGQFVQQSSLRGDIYSAQKSNASSFWVKIAEVFVTFKSGT